MDVSTLFFVEASLLFLFSVTLVVNSIGQLRQGANYWFAASNFCGGVSLVLHSFLPSDVFLTTIVSNLLLFVELCFLNKAIAEFVERGRHLWLGLLGLSVVATIVTFYVLRQHPNPELVMEFISVIAISTATCSAVLLFRYPPLGSKIPTFVMGTLFSLYVANNLVRSLTGYASLRFYHIWLDRTIIAGLSFGFLWMTAARLRNSLEHLAGTDALTGTVNRHRLEEAMKGMLAWNRRNDLHVAVFLIDLDRFKGINDNLGHGVGDHVLKALAARLNSAVRQEDMVGRLGGDEFVILQAGISQPEGAEFLTRRLIEILREPYDINGLKVICNASIGVAIAPGDAQQCDALFSCADAALYKAKAEGRNTVCFYEAGMDANLRERQQLERELRRALDLKAFQLAYQPLVTLRDGNLIGFEVLLRWPEGWDPQPPAAFIPVAESYGLIVPLGAWVLETACATAASWKKPLKLAINLSPVQFSQGDIVAEVTSALKSSGLDPARLELEVTESLWLQDTDRVHSKLMQLRSIGVSVSLDDFGTGYSSLAYLWKFPFDAVKIDRSFVMCMEEDPKAAAIVNTIVALGLSLSLTVTAEGVETHAQATSLASIGCQQAQGYLFGRPLSLSAANQLANAHDPQSAVDTLEPLKPLRDIAVAD